MALPFLYILFKKLQFFKSADGEVFNSSGLSGLYSATHFEVLGSDRVCRKKQKTWTESEAYAKKKGGRLCWIGEVKDLINKYEGPVVQGDRAYIAAKDHKTGKKYWVQASRTRPGFPGKVYDGDDEPWTENYDAYDKKLHNYPYWVGTV